MKKSLLVLLTVLATTSVYAAETKEVCTDVVVKGVVAKNKDGSTKQTCKTIKVHKKFEGTKVPEPAKKK